MYSEYINYQQGENDNIEGEMRQTFIPPSPVIYRVSTYPG